MRNYIYKDERIPENEYKGWMRQYKNFLKENAGISPTFITKQTDFSYYPTFIDSDSDVRPTDVYLKKLVSDVEQTFGKWAFDNVIIFIHEDNWRSAGPLFNKLQDGKKKGIWGTNYSYSMGNCHVQYCRFDKDNIANVFGTIYHEQFHSYDALTKVETNVMLEPILKVNYFDSEVVHGTSPRFEYIRHQENIDAFIKISPYIKAAYRKRAERHLVDLKNKLSLLQVILDLTQKLKRLLFQTNGVSN